LRKRCPAPGGTAAQQFSHLVNRLAWVTLPIEKFLVWRNATPAARRRRRDEIWGRFKVQRDDPVTRPALIERLKIVFDHDEIVTLLGSPRLGALEAVLPLALRPLLRPPSPLARAIAGIGLESLPPLPFNLASAIAGAGAEP
jgi:hypothetical protein